MAFRPKIIKENKQTSKGDKAAYGSEVKGVKLAHPEVSQHQKFQRAAGEMVQLQHHEKYQNSANISTSALAATQLQKAANLYVDDQYPVQKKEGDLLDNKAEGSDPSPANSKNPTQLKATVAAPIVQRIGDDKEKEDEADEFSARMLLSEKERNELFQYSNFDKELILKLSQKFKKHPGIIVAQIQRQYNHLYKNVNLNSLKPKVAFTGLSI